MYFYIETHIMHVLIISDSDELLFQNKNCTVDATSKIVSKTIVTKTFVMSAWS